MILIRKMSMAATLQNITKNEEKVLKNKLYQKEPYSPLTSHGNVVLQFILETTNEFKEETDQFNSNSSVSYYLTIWVLNMTINY